MEFTHIGRASPIDTEVALPGAAVAHPEIFKRVEDIGSQDPQEVIELVWTGEDWRAGEEQTSFGLHEDRDEALASLTLKAYYK